MDNDNRRIRVIDDLNPEDQATLQALYSRDPGSVDKKLIEYKFDSGKLMSKFYIGYGHDSIGDCGDTSVYVENVSMLAAKAIQNHPLYAGQESSTRYLNFREQGVHIPEVFQNQRGLHIHAENIVEDWFNLYQRVMDSLWESIKDTPKPNEDVSDKQWEKSLWAHVFDISRAFLPAGCKTNLSWSGRLRDLQDHCYQLMANPMSEVRAIGVEILTDLEAKYPNSFVMPDSEELEWRRGLLKGVTYTNPSPLKNTYSPFLHIPDLVANLDDNWGSMKNRTKRRQKMPRELGLFGNVNLSFSLDFGSFRDLQRHRNCYMNMPMLTNSEAFHSWYLEKINDYCGLDFGQSVQDEINRLYEHTESLKDTAQNSVEEEEAELLDHEIQYLIPMGKKVQVVMSMGLHQLVYLLELRTSPAVHPTLREPMRDFSRQVQQKMPNMPFFPDYSEDEIQAVRGKQDIETK